VPRAKLRPEEVEAFRAGAVAAATRLFAERGYDAVTMRSLAAELGCSPMTPYRYFENKDELFAAVKTEAFRRFADRQEAAAAAAADVADKLRRLERAYVGFAVDEPEAYRIMFELRQAPARHSPRLEAEQRRAFTQLRRVAEEAVAAGLMQGDPLTVAHLLWAHVHGIVSLHLAGKLVVGRALEDLCGAHIAIRIEPDKEPAP
jgi:AcrR family transcriptional regulator